MGFFLSRRRFFWLPSCPCFHSACLIGEGLVLVRIAVFYSLICGFWYHFHIAGLRVFMSCPVCHFSNTVLKLATWKKLFFNKIIHAIVQNSKVSGEDNWKIGLPLSVDRNLSHSLSWKQMFSSFGLFPPEGTWPWNQFSWRHSTFRFECQLCHWAFSLL